MTIISRKKKSSRFIFNYMCLVLKLFQTKLFRNIHWSKLLTPKIHRVTQILLIADACKLKNNTLYSQQLLKLDFFEVMQQPTAGGFHIRQVNTNICSIKNTICYILSGAGGTKHKNPYNEAIILQIKNTLK